MTAQKEAYVLIRSELRDIRSQIPPNTYRTILGQIEAGNIGSAKVGIDKLKKRIEKERQNEVY